MTTPLISALGGFSQVGMIVRDVDQVMRYMTETLGIGPFFVLREITLDNYWYRGAPAQSPLLTIGMGQAGNVQIEIIQQLDHVPSVYTEFIASGREGCQHLAIWFAARDAYTRAYDQLGANGLRIVQEAGSIEKRRSAYFESDIPGQPMIELSESLLPETRGLSDAVAQASREWDGADPLRMISVPA
jgi:hypothetical protein